MWGMRDKLAGLWSRMNPLEPSPSFLAKFLAFAVTMFAIAITIGHYTSGS